MNQEILETKLADLELGELRYLTCVGSTNAVAANWITRRKWFTPPGAALAFSLILSADSLRISHTEKIPRITALGAIAVSQTMEQHYRLEAKIKWPNDILLSGRKVAGVLSEASWTGDKLSALILGIGINVAPSAIPPQDWAAHHSHPFPATSVETALGQPVNRPDLLRSVLEGVLDWLPRWETAAFLDVWRERLAMRGTWVQIIQTSGADGSIETSIEGQIINLNDNGSLSIRLRSGEQRTVRVGDIHLRSVDSSSK